MTTKQAKTLLDQFKDGIVQVQGKKSSSSSSEIKLLTVDGNDANDDISSAHTISFKHSSTGRGKPSSTPAATLILSHLTQYVDANRDPFDLKSIYFAYRLKDRPFTEYFQECQRLSIRHIGAVQRKDLLDYIQGVTSSSQNIDTAVQEGDPQLLLHGGQHSGSADSLMSTEARAQGTGAENTGDNAGVGGGGVLMDARTRAIISRERVLETRLKAISGGNTVKSFEASRKLAVDILIKGKRKANTASVGVDDSSKGNKKKSTGSTGASNPGGELIIIVPAVLTSLLNMYNARQFLEKNSFELSDKSRKSGAKPDSIVIERTQQRTGKKLKFKIVDTLPPDFRQWENVVAVFCSGQKWQFSGWKWEDPVELFSKVKGFCVKYSDTKVDAVVGGWNVQVLDVNRFKRHLDGQVVHKFWNTIEQWIALNKSHLLS